MTYLIKQRMPKSKYGVTVDNDDVLPRAKEKLKDWRRRYPDKKFYIEDPKGFEIGKKRKRRSSRKKSH